MTLLAQLQAHLPAELRARVAYAQLELTPHRAERVVLRARDQKIVAIAHLDDPAQPRLLAQLRERLPGWSEHLPRPLGELTLRGRSVWLREFVRGTELHENVGSTGIETPAREGAALLAALHDATMTPTRFEEAHRRAWIDEPLAVIAACVGALASEVDAARRAARVAGEVVGATLPFAVHHGDYQLTNLIRRPDGTLVAIDWELSLGTAPAAMDLAHFLIGLGVSGFGLGYGDAVRAALDPDGATHGLAHELWADHLRRHPLDPPAQAAVWALAILHGTALLARRVPHLFDAHLQADMLGSIGHAVRSLDAG